MTHKKNNVLSFLCLPLLFFFLQRRSDRSAAEHRDAGLVHRRRERRRAVAAHPAHPLLHQEEQRGEVFRQVRAPCVRGPSGGDVEMLMNRKCF